MPLIYAVNFEFENPAIMEDKQYKQTERLSAMAKGNDYFLLLYQINPNKDTKAKINNIQEFDPYQIKKKELSSYISKFPPVQ